MHKRRLAVALSDGSFGLEVVEPQRMPAPAIVAVPSIYGLNDETERWLHDYADEGFVAAVYDPFWRIDPGPLAVDVEADRKRAQARRDAFSAEDGVRDLAAAVDALRALPACNGNVAVAGYCFGGRYALIAAARMNVQAAVTFHGIRMGDHLADVARIRVPASFHFGDADHATPMPEIRAIQAAVAGNPNVEIYVYAGVGHSFTWHGHRWHDPEAERLSWTRSMNVLAPLRREQAAL